MSDTEKTAMLGGIAIGCILMLVLWSVILLLCIVAWWHDAIKFLAARYNETTWAFEWIEKAEVSR